MLDTVQCTLCTVLIYCRIPVGVFVLHSFAQRHRRPVVASGSDIDSAQFLVHTLIFRGFQISALFFLVVLDCYCLLK